MDPASAAIEIAAALGPKLVEFIEQEIADNQKSEKEATLAALRRLADEEALAPMLPTIQAMIAEARKTAAERDVAKLAQP